MATEQELNEQIAAARLAYQAVANTEGAAALRERTEHIKQLMFSLSELLRAGAVPCACGELPHGYLKTPSYIKDGLVVPPVYAVRCVVCAPVETALPNGNMRVTLPAAHADTAEMAVTLWNAGHRVSKERVVPTATNTTET